MKILQISSALGSTLIIAENLQSQFELSGNDCTVIAPVHGQFDLAVSMKLWRWRRNFDMAHVHLGHAAIVAGRMARLTGMPTVATLHGFLKYKHYGRIQHFTAVSRAVKRHFVTQGAPAERIEVIPNGFSTKLPSYDGPTVRQELGIPEQTFVLGSVGKLTAVKKHDLLFQAFAEALSKGPDMALVIAGEGDLKARLRHKASALGIADKTFFLGFRRDIAKVYKGIDLLVQTSDKEGFCMPLLEAMACARPVVTTKSGGPEDFIRNNDNGVIVSAPTAPVMAEAIMRFVNNKDLCRRIGARAATSVQDMTWASVAARYLSYFERQTSRCRWCPNVS